LPTVTAPLEGGHSKGQAGAVVTVIEFSDFECGHCANAYRSLKQVLPRFQKDVQLRFHHFPLDSACNPAVKHSLHQYACLAAQAAECAGAQGKFWEYHDLLFDNQSRLDRDSLIAYAQRVGIARDTFLACLDSEAPRQAIARDVAEGMRIGIESTPTFFLNGRTITGAPRAHALGYAIQLERAARQRGEG
jgi:protein-disulfide isomerase